MAPAILLRTTALCLLLLTTPAAATMASAERALDRPSGIMLQELAWLNRSVNNLPLTDCKAFAFEKIRRLEAYGVTGRYVVVRTETGRLHAIVVLPRNDLMGVTIVMDSRRRDLTSVEKLRTEGYKIARLAGEP